MRGFMKLWRALVFVAILASPAAAGNVADSLVGIARTPARSVANLPPNAHWLVFSPQTVFVHDKATLQWRASLTPADVQSKEMCDQFIALMVKTGRDMYLAQPDQANLEAWRDEQQSRCVLVDRKAILSAADGGGTVERLLVH